jgi:hypothetical protein
VPPLVALLRDEEDRTRANAAGALGNLVRNGGALCPDIMRAGALQVGAARHAGERGGVRCVDDAWVGLEGVRKAC